MRLTLLSLVVVVYGLAGCDALFGLAHLESHADEDAPTAADAFVITHCNNAMLGPPVEIAELAGRALSDPELRNDQLEVFWEGNGAIWRAARSSLKERFVADPAAVPFDDALADDESPELDLDGTLLVFLSDRGGNGMRAYDVTRSIDGPWSPAELVPGVEDTTMNWVDISYDGLIIYYVDPSYTLHQQTRQSRSEPFSVDNTIGTNVTSLTVSTDALELYYRVDPGTGPEIWYARRTSILAPFPTGSRVLDGYRDPDLTPDGKHLIVDGPFVFDRSCQ